MSGDYTRFTFNPTKDFSGVFKQQGRVDLDADWNELIEIADRRWRSETIDIIGHCTVPATTPDAFRIAPAGPGTFDIGIGRMYVDGIQVESHGRPPATYLADLGEQRGTAPVSYGDQPYLPAPLPAALPGTPGTTDLVYIDVWQREVTVLEDPGLREIALGGPDTATRVQSVWQVRVLPDVGDHGCGDDIPEWNETVAPSAGRLTTSTVAPPASDDPCIISPTGGYRGLENRLYRVEIHAVGPIGGGAPAKFKWSRNNATIASSVTAIPSSTQVTVQQVGRDQVLRFDIGSWIELTDDFRELQGLAGHTAQITAIDEANRTLTFAPAIPGTIGFDPSDPTRHTRVRRWDQSQNVDASGLLDVTAGPIEIEDGIRVTFALDPAGGSFKVGDFWVFAARTADGSVELLDAAPPRGILHHFCRLGFIHWGANPDTTTVTDCREHWPPICCEAGCTVTVGDGVDSHGQFTDIQQAIDALSNRGGVVCIGRGFYTVRAGLVLDATKRNVIIRGMGPATRIHFDPPEGASRVFLDVRRTEHVRLESVFVVASDTRALVRISDSHCCRIEGCILVNLPPRAPGQVAPQAIQLEDNCSGCEIADNALVAAKIVAATGRIDDLEVRSNRALATQVAVTLLEARNVHIDGNQFRGLGAGALPPAPVISRDTIDAFQLQVSAAFRAPAAATNFQAAGILALSANGLVVTRNLITAQVAVFLFLGINVRVAENDVLALVGLLVIFGLVVKVEDNFVLGLLAGLLHAGILADLDCTANEWLGLLGIGWLSLGEMLAAFQPLMGGALGALGFATGVDAITTTFATGAGLTANLQAFGLVATAKLHRNAFISFFTGVFKADAVISADVSIVDNTFLTCSRAGIELGGGGRDPGTSLGLNPRHLVQGNAFAVQGRGVVSATPATAVEQNSVQCSAIGVDLDAPSCTARGNVVLGQSRTPVLTAGLITLHLRARGAVIADNELRQAPGSAILIQDDLDDLTVADNRITGAQRAGIGVRDSSVAVRRARIAGNRLEGCRGDVPTGAPQAAGVLVLSACQDVSIAGNTFTGNSPSVPNPFSWFVISISDARGLELTDNTIANNLVAQTGQGTFGAIGMSARGVVRIQGNLIRDNGGVGLFMIGSVEPQTATHALVENNHVASARGPFSLVAIFSAANLQFVGNQCLRETAAAGSAVLMVAATASVCSNTIRFAGSVGLVVGGAQLVVSANVVRAVAAAPSALFVSGMPMAGLPGQAVVTSNVASGIVAGAATLVRANNIPGP
jgi:hypothetical protein